jgi:hypothetical protein
MLWIYVRIHLPLPTCFVAPPLSAARSCTFLHVTTLIDRISVRTRNIYGLYNSVIEPSKLSTPLPPHLTIFATSYYCRIRWWKFPLQTFVSIVTMIYVFVKGLYSFIIAISALVEKYYYVT